MNASAGTNWRAKSIRGCARTSSIAARAPIIRDSSRPKRQGAARENNRGCGRHVPAARSLIPPSPHLGSPRARWHIHHRPGRDRLRRPGPRGRLTSAGERFAGGSERPRVDGSQKGATPSGFCHRSMARWWMRTAMANGAFELSPTRAPSPPTCLRVAKRSAGSARSSRDCRPRSVDSGMGAALADGGALVEDLEVAYPKADWQGIRGGVFLEP